jgi:hypothetical protein
MRKAGPLMDPSCVHAEPSHWLRETFIPQLFVTIFGLGHKLWDMVLSLDPSVELIVF